MRSFSVFPVTTLRGFSQLFVRVRSYAISTKIYDTRHLPEMCWYFANGFARDGTEIRGTSGRQL